MSNPSAMEEVERLKARMIMRSFYVMFRTIVDRTKVAPAMLDHYRWIIALEKEGKVFASGPLFAEENAPGVGMTIFRTDNRDDAAAMAADDPFVTAGAATFDIKRWQINEGRLTISVDFSDQSYRFD